MDKINPPDSGQKIIVIVGPTASGKSSLGIFLAKKFGGEIISADSRQVYKGMDIGTGKITKRERRSVKHHLIDVADPKKVFTVSDFKKFGQQAITDIVSRNKIPIIVGGAGFYVDSLLERIQIPEIPPNKKLRVKLEKQSKEQLFKRLKKLNPDRAKTIDAKNKRRIIRALEIVLTTKKPVPKSLNLHYDLILNADILFLGITIPQETLRRKIKIRLDSRLKQGMVREVKYLLRSGISHKRLLDFGLEYGWISHYLKNEIGYKEMREGLLKDIVKYSKRQMTWFKRNKEIHWIKNQREAKNFISDFVQSQ